MTPAPQFFTFWVVWIRGYTLELITVELADLSRRRRESGFDGLPKFRPNLLYPLWYVKNHFFNLHSCLQMSVDQTKIFCSTNTTRLSIFSILSHHVYLPTSSAPDQTPLGLGVSERTAGYLVSDFQWHGSRGEIRMTARNLSLVVLNFSRKHKYLLHDRSLIGPSTKRAFNYITVFFKTGGHLSRLAWPTQRDGLSCLASPRLALRCAAWSDKTNPDPYSRPLATSGCSHR